MTKMVQSTVQFVQSIVGLVDAVELLLLRLFMFGFFIYEVVRVICHL